MLFGLRLILAYNNRLFPCHKWLISTIEDVPEKPADIVRKANQLLETPTEEYKETFVNSILKFTDWGIPQNQHELVCTRFIEDNEWWWWKNRPNIAEW